MTAWKKLVITIKCEEKIHTKIYPKSKNDKVHENFSVYQRFSECTCTSYEWWNTTRAPHSSATQG